MTPSNENLEARSFNEAVRWENPGVGRDADYGRSRSAAVKLFCIACQGGSKKAVAECDAESCPLWLFRPYGSKERQWFTPPSAADYAEALEGLGRTGNPEALQAFRDEMGG